MNTNAVTPFNGAETVGAHVVRTPNSTYSKQVEIKRARLPTVQKVYGLTRTRIYELIGAGVFRAVKDGRALLIDVASVEEYLARLPAAVIRPQKKAAPVACGSAASIQSSNP
jgi:excisionase family DNA binding protein